MALRTERFPIGGSDTKFIECRLIYRLGGMNMFTYDTEPRGYWLSASPVVVERGMVTECPMDGLRVLLKEVSRASKKAEAEASAAMDTAKRDMVRKVCAKNGIDFATVAM